MYKKKKDFRIINKSNIILIVLKEKENKIESLFAQSERIIIKKKLIFLNRERKPFGRETSM